ncbi:MAG: hypothetical protein ACXAHE_03870 [Roseburia sp. 1XD42-69]|jgi:hypothetical protein
MRLGNSSKTILFGNIDLINYCKNIGVNFNILKKCNVEKMGNTYVFVLSKDNIEQSNLIIPLDIDMDSQPDIVLTMEVEPEGSIKLNTTDKTVRLLNI